MRVCVCVCVCVCVSVIMFHRPVEESENSPLVFQVTRKERTLGDVVIPLESVSCSPQNFSEMYWAKLEMVVV